MTLEVEPDTSLEESSLGVNTVAGTKAEAVDGALRDFINRASRKAANFSFAFVSFNDHVTNEGEAEELIDILDGRLLRPDRARHSDSHSTAQEDANGAGRGHRFGTCEAPRSD